MSGCCGVLAISLEDFGFFDKAVPGRVLLEETCISPPPAFSKGKVSPEWDVGYIGGRHKGLSGESGIFLRSQGMRRYPTSALLSPARSAKISWDIRFPQTLDCSEEFLMQSSFSAPVARFFFGLTEKPEQASSSRKPLSLEQLCWQTPKLPVGRWRYPGDITISARTCLRRATEFLIPRNAPGRNCANG